MAEQLSILLSVISVILSVIPSSPRLRTSQRCGEGRVVSLSALGGAGYDSHPKCFRLRRTFARSRRTPWTTEVLLRCHHEEGNRWGVVLAPEERQSHVGLNLRLGPCHPSCRSSVVVARLKLNGPAPGSEATGGAGRGS
jgi:hypothetical protein